MADPLKEPLAEPIEGAESATQAPPSASIEAAAQAMAQDMPAATGGAQAVAAAAPTDKWGRVFDPALHLAKLDGTPAFSRKGGLMKLPGTPDPDLPLVKGLKRGPTASRSIVPDLTQTGAAGAPAPVTGQAPAPGAPIAAASDGAPPMSEIDRATNARTQSRLLVRIETMAGRLFGGKDTDPTPEEKAALELTAYEHYYETGGKLPFGWLVIHSFELLGYLMRVVGGLKNFVNSITIGIRKAKFILFGGTDPAPPKPEPEK